MFFIFGLRKKPGSRGPVFSSQCYHCKNHVDWIHFKVTDWFELFFIPLLPFRSEHYLACEICGYAVPLDGEESRGVETLDQMDAGTRQEWVDYLVEHVEDHQFGNMSETQRNWHREQKSRGPDPS
jgi:hypothetical protein